MPETVEDCMMCLYGRCVGVVHIEGPCTLVTAVLRLRDKQVVGIMNGYVGKLEDMDAAGLLDAEAKARLQRRRSLLN